MLKLRLTRKGKIHAPFYRIVAIDSRAARDAEYLDCVGTYNPVKHPAEINIDTAKVEKWLKNGAQPTETVKSLLKKQGIIK